jgi:hypothetical protein
MKLERKWDFKIGPISPEGSANKIHKKGTYWTIRAGEVGGSKQFARNIAENLCILKDSRLTHRAIQTSNGKTLIKIDINQVIFDLEKDIRKAKSKNPETGQFPFSREFMNELIPKTEVLWKLKNERLK